eukprot:Em0015g1184a
MVLVTIYVGLRLRQSIHRDILSTSAPSFAWVSIENVTALESCRNSRQGHTFYVDELGYVCRLGDILPNGCCTLDTSGALRHDCSSCVESGCCAIYEHCVSCCLHPDKEPLVRNIVKHRTGGTYSPLYSLVRDPFEFCMLHCRTSSRSVHHENAYKDTKLKYCYGL